MAKIKVRMLTSMAGDPSCKYGDELEVEPEIAERWESRNLCEVVRSAPRERSKKAVSKKAGKK